MIETNIVISADKKFYSNRTLYVDIKIDNQYLLLFYSLSKGKLVRMSIRCKKYVEDLNYHDLDMIYGKHEWIKQKK